jgi:hypothetical protein
LTKRNLGKKMKENANVEVAIKQLKSDAVLIYIFDCFEPVLPNF